ncbi:hypothetical protein LEP1GSC133_0933 [Leptospira borgpetersenii serovar Pomona str. 200901868]|uniref:Uncharacterized protein n=1 Tax=Leptospira borgpetersenii serovar Pomona str. 200901868 TaxID=1192866 RepID=M6W3A9_LEPBO|nr:hypothetical protein LEP1GSC133_0933 [Leptospira borgpetersenii serovar Pomona str. 200901868]
MFFLSSKKIAFIGIRLVNFFQEIRILPISIWITIWQIYPDLKE